LPEKPDKSAREGGKRIWLTVVVPAVRVVARAAVPEEEQVPVANNF